MSAGMVDYAQVVLDSVWAMAATYALVVLDRRRLTSSMRERAWNSATTGAAILVFAPLCVIAHFWVTRRSVRGILLGLGALVLLLVTLAVLHELTAFVLALVLGESKLGA